MESSIGRERRVECWDDQDLDLDDGALNKVEGETDVTNRSASISPKRQPHVGNECGRNKFHREQPSTSLPNHGREKGDPRVTLRQDQRRREVPTKGNGHNTVGELTHREATFLDWNLQFSWWLRIT